MSEPSASGGSDRGERRRPAGTARRGLSAALAVVATLTVLAGTLAVYARSQIVDTGAFADRAVAAMRQPAIQRVVAREVVVALIERSSPDLITARPVLQSVIGSVVASQPFGQVIRVAAQHGHRLLFERSGGNAAFDIADAGTVAASALRTLAPKLATGIPPRLDAVLLTLRRRSFAAETLRFADAVRLMGIVLLPVGLVLLALAIGLAPTRRAALTRSAVMLGVGWVALVVGLELLRLYVVSHVYGTNELSNTDVRQAIGALWDSYLMDLTTAAGALAIVAFLVAAASASVLKPYSATATLRRARVIARRPSSTRVRAVRGTLILALGLLLVIKPGFSLRAAAVVLGVLLVYIAAGEVLSALPPVERRRQPRRRRLRAVAATAVVAAVVIATGLVLALGDQTSTARAGPALTCNGYAQLCSRRLDQVGFAGTHNSMSAADSPGWFIANQDREVAQQLQDGIRLFKISTHYGIQDSAGHVRTDIAGEGKRLNRVAAKLSPGAREALQRLGQAIGLGSLRGKRDIWLCHTLCELGATRMIDFLGTIRRFLELNRGQVVVLFDEDYVDEGSLASAFRTAGLLSYLATLDSRKPLPTLGELVRSNRNVLVFAQKPPSGRYPWNMDAFSRWIQDTPLGARKPAQFTCRLNRGQPTNPLLMMNDWADVFPPRPSPNVPLVTRSFLLHRARQCMAERGRIPNLILTDFYNRGDLIGAVRALNGLRDQRAAVTVPVTPTG